MAVIPEVFVRRMELASIQFQLETPSKIMSQDPHRVWASINCGASVEPAGITTNPFAQLGDPDVCMFWPGMGAIHFETYGTNELYILGLPVGTPIAVSSCVKKPQLAQPVAQDYRCATRIETSTVGGAVVFAGSFAPLLPADPARRRVHIKTDATALVNDGVSLTEFLPIFPFFPGYAVVEGTEALAFVDLGFQPTTYGAIIDREVSAL